MVFDALGDETDIREQAEAEETVGNDVADGIDGIVLDGEAGDGKVIDVETLTRLEGDPIGVTDIRFANDVSSFRSGVEGDWIFFDETFQATNVIAVFVGE